MLGMKFLKGDVSLDRGFAKRLSMTIQEIDRIVELMHLLPHLRNPQSDQLLLLQSCMAIAKLFLAR